MPVTKLTEIVLPGHAAVNATASEIANTGSVLPVMVDTMSVDEALLGGVLVSIIFFLALQWTQNRRPLYLGAIVFAALETLRLWTIYDTDVGVSGPVLAKMTGSPVMFMALSFASIAWIVPRLLRLKPNHPFLANFCTVHVVLLVGVVALGGLGFRLQSVDNALVVWLALFGMALCALGAWQALRGPTYLRMPAFCLCLGYLITTLVLLLDLALRLNHAPTVDALWAAAAIARLILVTGGILLSRSPHEQSILPPVAVPDVPLDLGAGAPLAELNLSTEQVERRLAETLSQLAGAVDMQRQINAMMSHELRMPVSTISAAAQSLEMILSGSGEFVDGRLARIRRSVARITELLEQFLGQDRFADKEFQLQFEALDLSQLAREAIANMQPDAGHSLMVDAPAPVIAWCDRPLTSVVLRNLVHNAIKYSPANQPVIVRARLVNINGAMTPTLSVIDRGPGIDQAEQARIFDAQYRRPSHRETKGMGIGLYLARRICAQQHGGLSVESTVGRGARFDITLPAPPAVRGEFIP